MAIKKQGKEESSPAADRRKILEARLSAVGIKDRNALTIGEEFTPTEFIPTGVEEIDKILGDGHAIPEGTLVEFCGGSMSGKTYLSYKTIASAHKQKKRCAYVGPENSFYEPRAESLGVQVRNSDLFEVYRDIDTAEKYGDLVWALTESGEYSVIVVDSISALIPEVDYKKGLGDNPKFGAHAAFIQRFTKKLLSLCSRTGTIVILINQFRMAKVAEGIYARKPTGGMGAEHFFHMRLWIERIKGTTGNIIGGDKNEIIGGKSKLVVQKTRYGQPGVSTIFPIYFQDAEVNPLGEFLYVAQSRGKEFIKVVRKKYMYIDKETGEVLIENIDAIEFMNALLELPVPTYKTKKDTSINAFDWIANQLKLDEDRKEVIIKCLKSPDAMITAPDDLIKIVEPEEIDEIDEE